MPFGNDSPFPLYDTVLGRWAQRGWQMDFMKARASRSRSFECLDMNFPNSVALSSALTVGATSTGTTWAILAEPGGWVRGVTGASVATGAAALSISQKYWNGTKGAGMAALIRLSAVTNVRVEMGFADVLPAIGTSMINTASQSFVSAVSGAVYLYDEGVSASAAISGLYTIGTSNAYGVVATTGKATFSSAATLFVALEIIGTGVQLWVGEGSQPQAVAASAFTAADGVFPFLQVKTASGSKNVDVDTFWHWTNGRNT